MFTKLQLMSALAAAGMALAAVPQISEARSVAAEAGRIIGPIADTDCFAVSYGSMTNVCPISKVLEIPLVSDGGDPWGTAGVRVAGFAPSLSSNVSCTTVAIGRTNYSYDQKTMPVLGRPGDIQMAVHMTGGDILFVACNVQPGGRVDSVNW